MTLDHEVLLRAERAGEGAGRRYTMTYRALDASGNGVIGAVDAQVPHDMGVSPQDLLLDLYPLPGSGRARISWSPITGALAYDVIRGDLATVRIMGDVLSLGNVHVLARGTTGTTVTEDPSAPALAPGRAFFYLVQWRTVQGGVGYGAESAPRPRIPDACQGGCP